MLVSVIIPNFNHAQFLEQRINSVINQDYENFEILILDDCSTDDSQNIILKYKNHPKVADIIFNQKNSGNTFAQWKKGIQLAKGDLIWIAESDDFSDTNFLTELIPKFTESNTVLAYCRSEQIIGEELVGIYQWGEHSSKINWNCDFNMSGLDFIDKCMRYRNSIPNASAVVFRKQCINEQLLQAKFQFCNDWVIWVDILKQGNVGFSSMLLNKYRLHSNTTRSIKPFKLELKRLKEYFSVIWLINSSFPIYTFRFWNLKWIFIEISDKFSLVLKYKFQNLKSRFFLLDYLA